MSTSSLHPPAAPVGVPPLPSLDARNVRRTAWVVALAAAALLGLTMGSRSSFGLFLPEMHRETGMSWAWLGLVVALGQLGWGLAQPVCGWLAGRWGTVAVVRAGALVTALALLATPWLPDLGVALAFIVAGMAGAAAGGAPLLMAAVAKRVPEAQRGMATGVVGAGGSAGQLVLAPMVAWGLSVATWEQVLVVLGAAGLLALPLSRPLARPPLAVAPTATDTASTSWTLALRDARYLLVSLGFFVCGFHVSFLTTHMPGVIDVCGLPATLAGTWLAIVGVCNIVGSLVSGALSQRWNQAAMLMGLYLARAVVVVAFLLAPRTELTMLLFAVAIGLSYMATLPPTVGLITRLHGTRHLAILMGLTMLLHQVGAFLGAWLGGLSVQWTGSYDALWRLDALLALVAAALHLPLWLRRQPKPQQAGLKLA